MSYGDKEWAEWVVGQEECDEHVKTFWDAGGNTFDTGMTVYLANYTCLVLNP